MISRERAIYLLQAPKCRPEEIVELQLALREYRDLVSGPDFGEWLRKNRDLVIIYDRVREYFDTNNKYSEAIKLLREAFEHQQKHFDGDEEFDDVRFYNWFIDWRDSVHTFVRTIEGKTQSSQDKKDKKQYSLTEIRNGTGWPEGVRFIIAD